MAGPTDILTTIQNGVVALNNLGKQVSGSFNNISSQLALTTRVKIQFNARDMTLASGNVAYTGIGFQPSLLVLFGIISTTQNFTIGVDDGGASAGVNAPRAYISGYGIFQTTGAQSMYFSADNINIQQAKVATFDADGFTLTWTKTGVPAAGNAFFTAIAFK